MWKHSLFLRYAEWTKTTFHIDGHPDPCLQKLFQELCGGKSETVSPPSALSTIWSGNLEVNII